MKEIPTFAAAISKKTMRRTIEFTKMHGAGNDYIYVNTLAYPIKSPEHLSEIWSDRHKGIGSDGLVLIGPATDGDFSMRIFNNDGSEALMCGNASRCIGKYLHDNGLTDKTDIRLETLSGIKVLHLQLGNDGLVETVTVDMGCPQTEVPAQMTLPATPDSTVKSTSGQPFNGTFVSMVNPHFVIFTKDVEFLDIAAIGPTLESAAAFPERCNIEFAEILSEGKIRMRVWERGSGITLACGTGACATAVAAALTARSTRHSTIIMDGGSLDIEWCEADGHVYMTGGATKVFDGRISYDE